MLFVGSHCFAFLHRLHLPLKAQFRVKPEMSQDHRRPEKLLLQCTFFATDENDEKHASKKAHLQIQDE